MAAALQARGVGPGDHVALLGPTPGRWSPPSRPPGWPAPRSMVLPAPDAPVGSIEEFVAQTRARHRATPTPPWCSSTPAGAVHRVRRRRPAHGRLGRPAAGPGRATADAFERPADDPGRLGDPPVHQRLDVRAQGRDAPAPRGVRQPRRHRGGDRLRPRHRRARVVAAAVPRHGPGRAAHACRMSTGGDLVLGGPAGLHGRARRGGWSGCRTTAAPPPPAPTSPGSSPPGPCASGSTGSTCPAADRPQRRRAGRPADRRRRSSRRARATGSAPAPCSRPSAWPRSPSPARSPSRCRASAPTPSTCGCSRRERYAAPVDADSEGARRLALLGRPVPGLEIRVVDPDHGRRAAATARSASWRSGARRSRPATTSAPTPTCELFHDGWLRTGDLAYLLDGELVMCGRIKDMIIVGGRNVYPEDVERAVADVDGVRAGNIIAFGVDGRAGQGGLVVVAESKSDDHAEVRALGRRAGADRHRPPGQGGRPRRSRQPAQDELRQAPALAVQGALPRRGAPSGLGPARDRKVRPPWSVVGVSTRCPAP